MSHAIVRKRVELRLGSVQKFVTAGTRKIRGFASTDSIDRQKDVVVPSGGEWQLPLPLLWSHSHQTPIGIVESIERRSNGLWITASVAEGIEDADRIWKLIDAQLATGFSIGFIGKKVEPLPNGGAKYVSWELVEISVVVVPANADAKIQRNLAGTIKLVSAKDRGIPLIKAGSPHGI